MRRLAAVVLTVMLFTALVSADDTAFRWDELKGKHFIIFHQNDERLATDVLRHAERYYGSIVKQLGFRRLGNFWLWERRVTIRMHASRKLFSEQTGAPEWAVAKVDFQKRSIDISGGHSAVLQSRLPHEIAHLIFREYIGFTGEIPLWLDEGVAQWCEWRTQLTDVPVIRQWIPLADLTRLDIRKSEDNQLAHIFYGQSASLVHYLVTVHGREKFTKLCRQLRDGKSLDGALRFTYPQSVTSMAVLEREWLAWQRASE